MRTLRVSVASDLHDFVKRQMAERGYVTRGEFVRDLIRRDQECQQAAVLMREAAGPKKRRKR
jgi:Arc/MetJ-type ribon-helix-helix transcriptional regulator